VIDTIALAARRRHLPANRMSITQNKKAFHDYTVEERFEAGLVLQGWEVKAIRESQAHLREAYVIVRDGELWLLNAHITPLKTVSTHITPEPARTRKLLLRAEEIRKLIGKVERSGYALVPLDLHFSKGRVKLAFGLAKGKRQYEKRSAEAEKEWKREQGRLLKQRTR
jgi:SsrA-binding protein